MPEAREVLRTELLAVAAAVVPGQTPVITHDPGPINPGALFDGRGPATICSITVETGEPDVTPDPAAAITTAASALTARGWTTEIAPQEAGHHRLAATREGYTVAVHAWLTDWRITFTGDTPYSA
ncbi:hypothetical protein F1D05_19595 [Kribbella qitaiheensis]|uniref:Uncharacterized protein n=1 Tax=Kribbella qitaiheensis TaxID=1544730 RepID=A0A7G6X9V4_9ACTN|nr:hypothetical protein F1D05_19595 [Kribbella qitaiheensis]